MAGEGEGQLVLPAMQRRVGREVGWEVRGEMVLWKSCRVLVGLEGCPEGSGHAVHVVLHGCYRRLHEATNCMVERRIVGKLKASSFRIFTHLTFSPSFLCTEIHLFCKGKASFTALPLPCRKTQNLIKACNCSELKGI